MFGVDRGVEAWGGTPTDYTSLEREISELL